MTKVLVLYGSTTGNTAKVASVVADVLRQQEDFEVTLRDVTDVVLSECENVDCIVAGASTWDSGNVQDDFREFLPELRRANLSTVKSAVFGLGDSHYRHFCQAVHILEETLKQCGSVLVLDSLRVDGEVDQVAIELVESWAKELLSKL